MIGEGLGTFLLLFSVEACVVNNGRQLHPEHLVLSSISTSFIVTAMVYSFADVSGAHFNPSVTFATMVTGKTTVIKGLVYIVIQLFASIMATLALSAVFPRPTDSQASNRIADYVTVRMNPLVAYHHAFFMEVFLTFILVYIGFATAFDTSNDDLLWWDLYHCLIH
jgi:glycerol uptake facilitator-like aquaporin